MKLIAFPLVGVATLAGVLAFTAPATNQEGAPIFVTNIPPGYRDWRLISVAHEEGNFHSFSAVLGNDLAIQAYREGKVPFPDGAIIAALHYRHVPSEENNKVFGQAQSFVPGTPTNIQFMVKDTKKYTATGGWGFAHFQDGKPGDEAFMKTCFPCHNQVKGRDLVYNENHRSIGRIPTCIGRPGADERHYRRCRLLRPRHHWLRSSSQSAECSGNWRKPAHGHLWRNSGWPI